MAFDKKNDQKFLYHGLEDEFKPEGYEIPENEKLSQEKVSYLTSDCKF